MFSPLLDDDAPWKRRFRAPGFLWAQVADLDPIRALAAANTTTPMYQLHAVDLPSGAMRAITDEVDGQASGLLSPDGRWVVYLLDRGGDEIGHYVRVPFEGGPAEDLTPELAPYPSFFRAFDAAGRRLVFVAGVPEGSRIYEVEFGADGSLGPSRLVTTIDALVDWSVVSSDGRYVAVGTAERSELLDENTVIVDLGIGVRVGELWDGEGTTIVPVRWSVGGRPRLLAHSNRTGSTRPLVWDLGTGERHDLPLPELEGDVTPLDWSPDGSQILACQTLRAEQRLFVVPLADERPRALEHAPGCFDGYPERSAWFGPDGNVLAHWQSGIRPQELVELREDAPPRVVLSGARVPASVPWRSITFSSTAGAEIQAWLALPEGESPFPLVLETHGGPTATQLDVWWPLAQVWVDHGFAFCSINYRGSLGFGRDFERAIWGNLGHLEVDDMAAARDHLVASGTADPARVLLTGWSYGGYLTLLAMGRRPDLWAGGMAGIAIADWASTLEDSSDVLREALEGLMGGPASAYPERYRRSSPVTYVDELAAPLLIIQGRNDTRCPARQVEEYERRAKAAGKDVEVVWFESGHAGWTDVEESIRHHEVMLRFAARVLGDGER